MMVAQASPLVHVSASMPLREEEELAEQPITRRW